MNRSIETLLSRYPRWTAYIYDTAFDKDSPVNFHAEMVWDAEQKEVDDWMHRSLPHWFPTRLGKHLEAGGLFKTIYGVLGHSRLLAVRSLNDFLFEPTRGRIAARANPVVGERIKQYLQQRVKPMLNDYYDARNAWLQKINSINFRGSIDWNLIDRYSSVSMHNMQETKQGCLRMRWFGILRSSKQQKQSRRSEKGVSP